MPYCSNGPRPDPAALRLAKARLMWRRAADDLLIDAIFDDMRSARRDAGCTGRLLRQAALGRTVAAPPRTGTAQMAAPVP